MLSFDQTEEAGRICRSSSLSRASENSALHCVRFDYINVAHPPIKHTEEPNKHKHVLNERAQGEGKPQNPHETPTSLEL
jgi:hypothetical protein